jgi:hypothetical protein
LPGRRQGMSQSANACADNCNIEASGGGGHRQSKPVLKAELPG